MDVIIIGGGITGLAAAYEVAQQGRPFTLLESASRLGGLIRTDLVDGFVVEAGPDSVLAAKPAAVALCEELGLGPQLIATTPPRGAFVLSRGQLFPIPSPSVLGVPLATGAILTYGLLPPAARLRMALEPWLPRRDSDDDESVAAFFARRFGRRSVALIAQPLLGGIHAGRIDMLSMHSLFPRFVDLERRHGSVLRGLRQAAAPTSPDGAFRSLSSGMGELVAAIGRRLPPGSVRLATGAVALARVAEGWRVTTAQGDLHARSVILAAPAYAAARLLDPIDHEASTLCDGVHYVSSVSIALAYARRDVRHPLAGSGFVVARRGGAPRITACTWVSSKWPGRAPEGQVLLRAFIGGADDPAAVDLPDAELTRIAAQELTGILGLSNPPLFARVSRWRDAGAQHTVGHLTRLARLDARLALQPGLFVAGSGLRSIGIPDCIENGRAAGALAAQFVQQPA